MFYFVATPIGNLQDFSFRAVQVLKDADLILCEDTRTSAKLLNKYDINKPVESYHKFNYKEKNPLIINKLLQGKNICLISDAGTPCISDPGSELIQDLKANGITYSIVPGACAFVNAFALSGFKTPVTFIGFLPDNKKSKRELLLELKTYKSTLIFYSATHEIFQQLKELYEAFGNREACVVRELTKIHEEICFFKLEEAPSFEQKGEFVIIIEGAENIVSDLINLSVEEHYQYYISLNISSNNAIKQVAKDRKLSKSDVYNYLVKLKNK